MEKADIKNVRAELEAEQKKKANVFFRMKKAAAGYLDYQKKETVFRIELLPVSDSTKQKLVKTMRLPELPKEERQVYNRALVNRYLKRGEYMNAYEAFWSTWNPSAKGGAEKVYRKLGGNKHPVKASLGSWAYSAVKHTIVPTSLAIYAIEAGLGYWHAIPYTAAGIATLIAAAGAPVVYNKWLRGARNKATK